jgi:cyanate permease
MFHPESAAAERALARPPRFYYGIFAMTGLLQHQISYLRDLGFDPAEAALALTVTTSTSVLSRVALGLISERLSKKYLVCARMVLQAFAIATIVLFPVRPVIMAEFFSAASLGAIMGVAALFSNGLTGFGSTFAGALREATGSYATPFLAFAGLELLAAATVLLARRPGAGLQKPVPS